VVRIVTGRRSHSSVVHIVTGRRSHSSVVRIVTGNFCAVWDLNPGRGKGYFLPHLQTGSGAHPSFCSSGCWGSLLEVKWLAHVMMLMN